MNSDYCTQQVRELVDDCNPLSIYINELYDGANQCSLDDKQRWLCRK
jgi:hypothetical protein